MMWKIRIFNFKKRLLKIAVNLKPFTCFFMTEFEFICVFDVTTSKALNDSYLLDVFWGQLIKLAQVASTSELLENQQNELVFFKIIPPHFCRASEASKIDCF